MGLLLIMTLIHIDPFSAGIDFGQYISRSRFLITDFRVDIWKGSEIFVMILSWTVHSLT